MVKNLLAKQEMWVQSLSWEDPLEKEMATHSSILAWEIPWGEGAWQATVHGVAKESDTTEQLNKYVLYIVPLLDFAALGLCCCPHAFSSCCEHGLGSCGLWVLGAWAQ